jgi:hypothetical protein
MVKQTVMTSSLILISPSIFYLYKKEKKIQDRRKEKDEESYQTIKLVIECITHVEQTDLEFLPYHLMDI